MLNMRNKKKSRRKIKTTRGDLGKSGTGKFIRATLTVKGYRIHKTNL